MSIAGQIAEALELAAQCRLVLIGAQPGVGFWTMPHGAPFVRLCWRVNLDRARRLRLADRAPGPCRYATSGTPKPYRKMTGLLLSWRLVRD